MDVEVTWISDHIITLVFLTDPIRSPWMLSLVHGPVLWQHKRSFWHSTLSSIADSFAGPWCCLGDFNSIVSQAEKWEVGMSLNLQQVD